MEIRSEKQINFEENIIKVNLAEMSDFPFLGKLS